MGAFEKIVKLAGLPTVLPNMGCQLNGDANGRHETDQTDSPGKSKKGMTSLSNCT
ncbi:hypothetical protein GCM10023156_37680 [Novipirellula rosea]|uniref:Uncharacterized protein n=1 Tax=Novipirellula rosea TaxID=1031540 RepID=A0ABP8N2M5_9BACT